MRQDSHFYKILNIKAVLWEEKATLSVKKETDNWIAIIHNETRGDFIEVTANSLEVVFIQLEENCAYWLVNWLKELDK